MAKLVEGDRVLVHAPNGSGTFMGRIREAGPAYVVITPEDVSLVRWYPDGYWVTENHYSLLERMSEPASARIESDERPASDIDASRDWPV